MRRFSRGDKEGKMKVHQLLDVLVNLDKDMNVNILENGKIRSISGSLFISDMGSDEPALYLMGNTDYVYDSAKLTRGEILVRQLLRKN
jgi:hypothetical protein